MWKYLACALTLLAHVHAVAAESAPASRWAADAVAFAKLAETETPVTPETWRLLEEEALAKSGAARLQALADIAVYKIIEMDLETYERIRPAYDRHVASSGSIEHQWNLKILDAFQILSDIGDFDKAESELKNLLNAPQLTSEQRALIHIFLAYLYADSGQSGRAIAATGAAGAILEAPDTRLRLQSEYFSVRFYIAMITSDYEEAISLLVRVTELDALDGWPVDRRGALGNITSLLLEAEFLDDAKVVNQIDLRLSESIGDKLGTFYSNYQCGLIAAEGENYIDAVRCYDNAFPFADMLPERKLSFLADFAATAALAGDPIKARELLEAVKQDPRAAADPLLQLSLQRDESYVLFAEGARENAFNLLRQASRDIARQREVEMRGVTQELRHFVGAEADRLKERAEMLKQQAALQEEVINRQKSVVTLSIVIVAFLLIFGALQLRARSRLESARREAVAASRAKSEFLANMSHEIRTPMNGILGMAQLLSETTLSERQRLYSDTIYKSGTSLMTIINDILDFSKIEAGRIVLDESAFNLREAVEDVATLLGSTAREKSLELIVRWKPELAESVIGDAGRFRQILVNLVGNAIKFTPNGYVLISVTGEVVDGVTNIDVTVQDTGIGIEPDKLESVFEQFTQAENSTTRRFGGTGLGLTITRSLVRAMGGDISATSIPGEGSTFTVALTLPVCTDTQETNSVATTLEGASALIVDDLDVNRCILEEQMRAIGVATTCANSATQALATLRRCATEGSLPDVAILDYHMPDMDGLELAKRLAANPALKHLKFVVLTSVDDDEVTNAFRKLGATDVLVKPVRNESLIRAIGRALGEECVETLRDAYTKAAPVVDAACAQDANLLIVDDNEVNRLVISNMIDPSSYRISFAEDGAQAVEAYETGCFELIFMDISMPVIDGIEASRKIREIENDKNLPATPIIALTAHVIEGDRERFLSAGMDAYITKPVKKAALTEILREWLPTKKSAPRRRPDRRSSFLIPPAPRRQSLNAPDAAD